MPNSSGHDSMCSPRKRRRARPPPMARAAPTTTKPTTPVPTPVKAKPDDAPVVADVPSDELPDAAAVAAAAVVEVVDDVDDSGVTAMVVVVVGDVVVVDELVVVVVEDVVVVDEVDVVVVVSSVALLMMPFPSAADATPTGSIMSATSASNAAPKTTNTGRILLTISLPVRRVLLLVGFQQRMPACSASKVNLS